MFYFILDCEVYLEKYGHFFMSTFFFFGGVAFSLFIPGTFESIEVFQLMLRN